MSLSSKLLIALVIIFSTVANFSYASDTATMFGDSTYEGQYKSGKAHGVGIFTFADGSKYEGKFRKNKVHGKGKYTDVNGKIFEGKWRYGKFKNKLDRNTREIVKLDLFTGQLSYIEIRGKGDLSSKWFEAEKNSSGTYVLTSKGEKDKKKAEAAAKKGDPGAGDNSGGSGGGSGC
tara:strand:+ start:268 stop:795 length:528 start_codon:yes stop_codon:yes gene_type:complete